MLRMLAGEAARRFAGKVAFNTIDPAGPAVTFAELDDRSDRVAAGLAERGVLPGDVVALALPPVPELAICYLGAAKIGAITARYDPAWPAGRRARVHGVVRPRLTIVDAAGGWPGPRERENAPAAAPASAAASAFAAADTGTAAETAEVEALDLAGGVERALAPLSRADRPPPPMPPDPRRPVAVSFSAGTTGLPKAALFGDRQLDAIRLACLGQRWGTGGPLIASGTTVPSLAYAHPDLMIVLPVLLQAGHTVHLAPPDPEAGGAMLAALTAGLGCPLLAGTPDQLARALATPPPPGLDLGRVRAVVIAGGPVPEGLIGELHGRLGVPVCVRYTCAEVGLGVGTRPEDPVEDAETTVGRPAPGVIPAIRDPAGRPAGRGQPGELLLRSAAVMSGYWNEPDVTAEVIAKDGFVRTGDLGTVDDAGRIRIVGRAAPPDEA